MLKAISAALAAACLLQGCALLPDYVGPEIEHMSHATQHEPLTDHPTNYGSEILGLTVEWSKPGGGLYVDVTEGIDLDPCRRNFCGEIAGPLEQFTARIGWRFRIKPQI